MKKQIISILLAMCVVSSSSAFALSSNQTQNGIEPRATTTFLIDNDTIDSSCSNSRYGFNEYLSDTGHYNNDARRQLTKGGGSYWYRWESNGGFWKNGTIYAKVGVYVNNKYFLDSAAEYYVERTYSTIMAPVGTLNQNYAKAGWNYFNEISLDSLSADDANKSSFVEVWPSGNNQTGYTGADAIQVTYR